MNEKVAFIVRAINQIDKFLDMDDIECNIEDFQNAAIEADDFAKQLLVIDIMDKNLTMEDYQLLQGALQKSLRIVGVFIHDTDFHHIDEWNGVKK